MEEKNITYKELVQKIKNKEFSNIVFLTGAGISTSSGIPDFRSPAGLYSTLKKYNLDYPEQIFEIKYFTQNPLPFYEVEKVFISRTPHFTSAHYFISEMNRRGQLLYNFTQNIDGLELQAGIPDYKLCQVHGNMRGARCQKCGFKHDINKFIEFVEKQVIYKCENCKRGLVRPNVVFFGEKLDKGYEKNLFKIAAADCVFIMGTSMQVAPFNMSIDKISKNVPVIVVNRDMVYQNNNKYIHMKNDIDDNIERLMTDLGWDFPKIERTYPPGWNTTNVEGEDSNSNSGSQDEEKKDEDNEDYSYSSGYYNDPYPCQFEIPKSKQQDIKKQEKSIESKQLNSKETATSENEQEDTLLEQLEQLNINNSHS